MCAGRGLEHALQAGDVSGLANVQTGHAHSLAFAVPGAGGGGELLRCGGCGLLG